MNEHVFQSFRERHQLSQDAFGRLLGIDNSPQGRVSHWETGRQPVPVEFAHAFIAVARDKGDDYTLEDVFPPHAAA